MIRGTTPTFTLTISDETVDLTQATHVYATFKQGNNNAVTKMDEQLVIYPNAVEVYLDQEDTLKFKEGVVQVQMNWVYANNSRASTDAATIKIGANLIPKVLPEE